jgi:hypothetical protein
MGCFHEVAVVGDHSCTAQFDKSNSGNTFCCMIPLQDFDDAKLVLPGLGLRIQYQPDFIIIFKSRRIKHYVASFKGTRSTLQPQQAIYCPPKRSAMHCKGATAITTCDQKHKFATTVTHLCPQSHLCDLRRIIASTVTHLRLQPHVLVHAISSDCTYI